MSEDRKRDDESASRDTRGISRRIHDWLPINLIGLQYREKIVLGGIILIGLAFIVATMAGWQPLAKKTSNNGDTDEIERPKQQEPAPREIATAQILKDQWTNWFDADDWFDVEWLDSHGTLPVTLALNEETQYAGMKTQNPINSDDLLKVEFAPEGKGGINLSIGAVNAYRLAVGDGNYNDVRFYVGERIIPDSFTGREKLVFESEEGADSNFPILVILDPRFQENGQYRVYVEVWYVPAGQLEAGKQRMLGLFEFDPPTTLQSNIYGSLSLGDPGKRYGDIAIKLLDLDIE